MWAKVKQSWTMWLGAIVSGLGYVGDYISLLDTGWGGLAGLRQQITDAGYDPGSIEFTFKVLGPAILAARLRSLLKKDKNV